MSEPDGFIISIKNNDPRIDKFVDKIEKLIKTEMFSSKYANGIEAAVVVTMAINRIKECVDASNVDIGLTRLGSSGGDDDDEPDDAA